MLENSPIPKTFLENVHMVNTATNFFNSNKDINDINSLYNKTTNDFSPFNTNNNYNNYNNYNTTKLNTINLNNKEINAMNEKKRFLWKEINTLNYNEFNNKDEKLLENPVIKNILNSNINENEIQNMPENYLVNLIHTLQNLANNAIKNNNFLENENKQLYHDLEMMKTNNEYLSQKNIKINQKLNTLNKQRDGEKKTMHDLFEENSNNYNFLRTKKYYCEICTNKKFKSQKYLDEHIARRHPDYINKKVKQKNKKENKLNIELYQKKLNDMKNYFDNLIYKSIKKIQYIKINEKLNSLQNLYEMGKYFNNINNNNITNININNSSYQEEINIENNSEINTNNLNNNNINTNLNNNIIEEKEKEKKTETENSGSMEKTEENSKRKQNDLMEKNHGNFIHNCLLLKKKMKFIKIKKFFEPKPEDQIIQQRSKKKRKTQKNRSKLLVPDSTEEPSKEENKKLEFNEEKTEQNNDDKNILKTKNEKNLEENKKEKEDNININNNKENIITKENLEENKEQELTHNEKLDLKLKEETVINFSDEEEEKNRVLKQFCLDFKSRDSNLSLLQERYYLKKVLPKDYNLDKKKVDEIIKEKINKKIGDFNPREKTIQQMRSKMMKIYYEVVDLKDKNDDMYLYSYLNISNFLNLQDLIRDANNNNFLLEASFFENVSYKVEENNSEFYNEDESQQNNNEASNDFSFKMN